MHHLNKYNVMCLSKFEYKRKDELKRSLDLPEIDSTLWNDKCHYMELEKCHNLNPNEYNLIVLQLNIRSILAHELELKQLPRSLEKCKSKTDIVLLCKTFLLANTTHLVNIPGYMHICKHRTTKKGGGVSILLQDGVF